MAFAAVAGCSGCSGCCRSMGDGEDGPSPARTVRGVWLPRSVMIWQGVAIRTLNDRMKSSSGSVEWMHAVHHATLAGPSVRSARCLSVAVHGMRGREGGEDCSLQRAACMGPIVAAALEYQPQWHLKLVGSILTSSLPARAAVANPWLAAVCASHIKVVALAAGTTLLAQ